MDSEFTEVTSKILNLFVFRERAARYNHQQYPYARLLLVFDEETYYRRIKIIKE